MRARGLRLRTGTANAVLGRPVSEFTDQQVLLDSILGVRDFLIAEKVLAATTPSQRVAALQNVLTGYLADTDPLIDTAVTRAIGMMRRHPDRPVSSLAVAVDLSERQLRRRFETAVGYGPKRFGRILRFRRLLDLIHTRGARTRWAELAVEAHYANQPHMINECLDWQGCHPPRFPEACPFRPIRPRVIRLSLCRMTDPKAIALESFRLIETGEAELAQRIIAPDYVNQEADDDPDDVGRQLPGPAGFLATSKWLRDAFSDLRFELHETVAEEGVVMAAATMTGEHRERSTASNPPASGSATSRCVSSRSLTAGSPITALSVTTWACCYNSAGTPAAGDVDPCWLACGG